MQSRWSDAEAAAAAEEAQRRNLPPLLGHRIYTSRLIGQDPDLVLHGGGNTSVKIGAPGTGGVIHVKGSGWDLADIDAPGLPALHLDALLEARDIPSMSDEAMVAFLRANLLDPGAPNPSVETLLHAFLPHAFVDHCHATSILALADQDGMEAEVARLSGGRLAFVPYVMPGYDLSHAGLRAYLANPAAEGLWLEKHGLFTFGATARESYERLIRHVTLAEEELARRGGAPGGPQPSDRAAPEPLAAVLHAALAARGALGSDPRLDFRSTPALRRLLSRDDCAELVGRGTATPDHVIRIKPFPLILSAGAGRAEADAALDRYAAAYRAYFDRHAPRAAEPKTMLDPLPRAVLAPGEGIFGLGRTEKEARIVGDLWEQTARIVLAAETWGRYAPIPEADLFDMEYWSLEQAKLAR
jgi:rhamnose utilization protein RhaD (predicted bifunctional aldolase and dehydrogenase)